MPSEVIDHREKWDAFLRSLEQLKRLRIDVGILSGVPRYPAGHRGKSSREYDKRRRLRDPDRFKRMGVRRSRSKFTDRRIAGEIRRRLSAGATGAQVDRTLGAKYRGAVSEAMGGNEKAAKAKWRQAMKRAKGTQVAKVAAVLGFVPAWTETARTLPGLAPLVEQLHAAILNGAHPGPALESIGRFVEEAFRRDVRGRGRVDTGMLLRTVTHKIVDAARVAELQEERRVIRAARRRLR